MSVRTDKTGQIVKQKSAGNSAGRNDLATLLERMGPQMRDALPKHCSVDRMTRIAMTALRSTPKLAQCDRYSFLGSVLQASQLGLEVNTPMQHAHLIPFEDRKRGITQCQLIIGYQGMIDLALRSGRVTAVYAHSVREGDAFEYELGLEKRLRHVPSTAHDREARPITHVYAVAKIRDAEPAFEVLTAARVESIRAMSRSSSKPGSPWLTSWEAMALKTAVRQLFKWIPKSAEMAHAAVVDESSERGVTIVDADVQGALESVGITPQLDEHQSEPRNDVPPHDPETGEVSEPEAEEQREPGEDG